MEFSSDDYTAADVEKIKALHREHLRDKFAMAALTGLLADGDNADPAPVAYRIADAMLKAREAKP